MSEYVLEDLQCKGLYIYQTTNGYRFTSDAVALSNYVSVKNGGVLLDLCSGSGVIGILANAKNKISQVIMVEIQQSLADMAKASVEYNKIDNITIINDRLQGIHNRLNVHVDTIVCNPPYYKANEKAREKSNEIFIARNEVEVTILEIVQEASKILKEGGKFYMSIKENRLIDVLMYLRENKLEPKELRVLDGKSNKVVLIKAIKGGEPGLNIVMAD